MKKSLTQILEEQKSEVRFMASREKHIAYHEGFLSGMYKTIEIETFAIILAILIWFTLRVI